MALTDGINKVPIKDLATTHSYSVTPINYLFEVIENGVKVTINGKEFIFAGVDPVVISSRIKQELGISHFLDDGDLTGGEIEDIYAVIEALQIAVAALQSGAVDIVKVAGENISANVPIYISGGLAYACKALVADSNKCIGISKTSALLGANVNIAISGTLTNINWTFAEGAVYIGNSILTQSITTQEYTQQVAVALNATTILINIQQAIEV